MIVCKLTLLTTAMVFSLLACSVHAAWRPISGGLMTRWSEQVSPDKVLPEHPRPQMVRPTWRSLNGLWDHAIRPKDEPRPETIRGKILVPFPIESALSGVKKAVGEKNRLWYRRTFDVPSEWRAGRLLLHFEAVDWDTTVWVNGKEIGSHKGGYDPFTFDITESLTKDATQELVLSVWDPTDRGFQPRGKQVSEPKGIWYTAVTGIWRTVWLEPVPVASIDRLEMVPDVDAGILRLTVKGRGTAPDAGIKAVAKDGANVVATAVGKVGQPIELKIAGAKLWSPDSPFLYDLAVELQRDGKAIDQVTSYFGMRKIAVAKDEHGFNRLMLNNKPLFQCGPLDQGWWPDGLYTAPTDEALRYDVEITRKLGFNMARKHVKVEPRRWYYHCDKLGLMVWQDMPSGDKYIRPDQPDIERTPESAANFRREFQAVIETYHNHPCIVAWVPFNEGWGQFETDAILAWVKQLDPTRLVDGPSGWSDRGTGDMNDMHKYPGPGMPKPEPKRAIVLGEFGGLGLPIEGHLWWNKRNWGYRTFKTRQELQVAYDVLIKNLRPLIGMGLSAAVYTQTTDVEGEVNGLMTYDRAIIKFDADKLARMHAKLYLPPPLVIRNTIVPTSEESAQTWRYTTTKPPEGWMKPGFDDASWSTGQGGFGTKGTPGAVVRTQWDAKDIWLRRTFELKGAAPTSPVLRIHHDEDAEVYVNGTRIASLKGFESAYIEVDLSQEAKKSLRAGANVIAVHCRQTRGGQYVDVGLVDVVEKPAKTK
ncbi:MAG: hypothetical protein JXQ73_03205 [Phycisphaerae bacterium]|nr:hypothetical protein [Phycisphaerae bacterium]